MIMILKTSLLVKPTTEWNSLYTCNCESLFCWLKKRKKKGRHRDTMHITNPSSGLSIPIHTHSYFHIYHYPHLHTRIHTCQSPNTLIFTFATSLTQNLHICHFLHTHTDHHICHSPQACTSSHLSLPSRSNIFTFVTPLTHTHTYYITHLYLPLPWLTYLHVICLFPHTDKSSHFSLHTHPLHISAWCDPLWLTEQ